jgi:hypothetical protein
MDTDFKLTGLPQEGQSPTQKGQKTSNLTPKPPKFEGAHRFLRCLFNANWTKATVSGHVAEKAAAAVTRCKLMRFLKPSSTTVSSMKPMATSQ